MVAVFAPYGHNGRVAAEAVRRGCHVISEKPLAGTLRELQQLRDARDKTGARVTALLPMRLMPAFRAAHKAVAGGLIGEPVLVTAQKSYQWGETRPWFYRTAQDYGGSIPWVAIHAVDFIRYVTGQEFARSHRPAGVESPSRLSGVRRLRRIAHGDAQRRTGDHHVRLPPAGQGAHPRRRPPARRRLRRRHRGAPRTQSLVRVDHQQERAPATAGRRTRRGTPIIDFAAALRGLHPHYLTPEDPFIDTEVCLKARDSAEKNTTVKL